MANICTWCLRKQALTSSSSAMAGIGGACRRASASHNHWHRLPRGLGNELSNLLLQSIYFAEIQIVNSTVVRTIIPADIVINKFISVKAGKSFLP